METLSKYRYGIVLFNCFDGHCDSLGFIVLFVDKYIVVEELGLDLLWD